MIERTFGGVHGMPERIQVYDLDEVCAEFMLKIVQMFGEPERWDTYSLANMYPKHKEFKYSVYDAVRNVETYKALKPVHGAAKTIEHLYGAYSLKPLYVTARPADAREITIGWLTSNNFPNPSNLVITDGHDEKIDFLKDLQPWGILEDRGSTALGVSAYIENVYLFDQPWNRGFKSLRRVLNWNMFKYVVLTDIMNENERRDE